MSQPIPLEERKKSAKTEHVEWAPLAVLLVGGLLLWAFIGLSDNVLEGDTESLDRHVLLMMRNADNLEDPIGPRWIEEMGRDFTGLGGVGVLTLLTTSVVMFLLLLGNWRAALFILVAVVGAIVISTSLKMLFDRPRPDLVSHRSYVHTASFPSGHSMMAAAVYLTLGAMTARFVAHKSLQVLLISVALTLTLLIGLSRVYLGVHWPTDVLGGWCLGAAWAILCWYIAGRLQVYGQLEPELEHQDQLAADV